VEKKFSTFPRPVLSVPLLYEFPGKHFPAIAGKRKAPAAAQGIEAEIPEAPKGLRNWSG
jgi:hypothetical protein